MCNKDHVIIIRETKGGVPVGFNFYHYKYETDAQQVFSQQPDDSIYYHILEAKAYKKREIDINNQPFLINKMKKIQRESTIYACITFDTEFETIKDTTLVINYDDKSISVTE